MNICDHCAKASGDRDTFCMGCGRPLSLPSTDTAFGTFDPDAFRRMNAERELAYQRKNWVRFRNLSRQIGIECNKEEAVRGERYATIREINKVTPCAPWVDRRAEGIPWIRIGVATVGVAGVLAVEGVRAVWGAFRQSYDSAYEDAKRASEEYRKSQSYRESKSNDRPSEPAKPRRSPYHVLGVRENAPWSEIKSAYHKAMMNLHPDRVSQTGMDTKTATARTQEINAAYVELEHQMSPS
jgi:hypothetical protein